VTGRNLHESWAGTWVVLRLAVSDIVAAFVASARRRGDQLAVGDGEVVLIGEGLGHREFDAPHAGGHQRADLEQL
jgi:uncharacterized protein YjlB